jgi:hypothetical protein
VGDDWPTKERIDSYAFVMIKTFSLAPLTMLTAPRSPELRSTRRLSSMGGVDWSRVDYRWKCAGMD